MDLSDTDWQIIYQGFDPSEEKLREALYTLGNGYFAIRGALCESSMFEEDGQLSDINYPATYVAGVYNKLATHISGKTIYNESIVNCPNWAFITFKIGEYGEWFTPSKAEKLHIYQQILDMKNGALRRKIRIEDKKGRKTSIESIRIVSMSSPHLGAIKYVITPENYSEDIFVKTKIEGGVINGGVERYRELSSKHLIVESLGELGKSGIYLNAKTNQSGIGITEATTTRIFINGEEKQFSPEIHKAQEEISQIFKILVQKGNSYQIEKTAFIYTSCDREVDNYFKEAINSANNSGRFEDNYNRHQKAWSSLWDKFNINIKAKTTFTQKMLRFHTFHLLQTVSSHNKNIDAGLPARGLHGEGYRGYIFWDEIYTMPFFNLRTPSISKSLIMYRYRRLDEAKKYAKENGKKGACFPWNSASTGQEEAQKIHLNPVSGEWGPDYSRFQRHISFDIAYNVWKYYEVTQDIEFLSKYGAEIILLVARFGASLVKYEARDDRYHTEGLVGPDEFHEKYPGAEEPGLKDNAYSNFLISWTLGKANTVLSILSVNERDRLEEKLSISKEEVNNWKEISKKMKIVFDDSRIIAQFDGYFDLKELDWQKYREKYESIGRMDRILKGEGDTPNKYKVAKQADTLMIFYLFPFSEVKEVFDKLGYKFSKQDLAKNYDYYIQRTSHGSNLSKIVHSYLAHLLEDYKEAWRLYQGALKTDIFDTQGGTTQEGIHTGNMGATIDVMIRSFAGVKVREDKIEVCPKLFERWQSVSFKIKVRGVWMDFSISHEKLNISIGGTKGEEFTIPFEINSQPYQLSQKEDYEFSLK